MGGTHWTCFHLKGNKLFYFDGFQSSGTFLGQKSLELISFHNFKFQDKNGRVCGSYCYYFFYLIE